MPQDDTIDLLYRRNTVLEALRGRRRELHRLWLQDDARQAEEISAAARARGIPIEIADKGRLSSMVGDGRAT